MPGNKIPKNPIFDIALPMLDRIESNPPVFSSAFSGMMSGYFIFGRNLGFKNLILMFSFFLGLFLFKMISRILSRMLTSLRSLSPTSILLILL